MSLQMPPAGGGYSRTTESGIFIPRDLIARDASGETVALPARVGRHVLETTPASIASEFLVLPLRAEAERGPMEFLRARDADDLDATKKLEFIFNCPVTFCYADRSAVERLIDLAYLDGEIQNCDRPLSAQCPRAFQRLAVTDDPRCRICDCCDRAVRLDASEDARRLRASAGLLTAEPECLEVIEVLQEFVSYSTGATPEDAAAWPQWAPTRRPRYEILELPEPF